MPSSPTRQNYHSILGVSRDATKEELRTAYKHLALKWHPDRHQDMAQKELAEQKFVEVQKAYRYLTRRAERRRPRIDSLDHSPQSETSFHSDSGQTDWPSFRSPHSRVPRLSPTDSPRPSMSGSSNSCTHPSGSETLTTPPSTPISHKAHGCPDFNESPTNHAFPLSPSMPKPPGMTMSAPPPTRSSSFLRRFPRRRTSKVASMRSSWTLSSPTRSHHIGSGMEISSSLTPSIITPHMQVPDEQKKSRSILSLRPRRMLKRKKSFLDVKLKPLNGTRLSTSIKSSTKEWMYPLQLTLEELFHGTNHTFHITRHLRNKEKMQVEISLPIPAGCRTGAQIRCAGAGNECKDGTFQDIVFVTEEIPHHQFKRKKNDLYVDLHVPWENRMARRSGELSFMGLDGQEIHARIPKTPPRLDKSIEGQTLIKGAGMPIVKENEVVKRGDLYVKWEISKPSSQWIPMPWKRIFNL